MRWSGAVKRARAVPAPVWAAVALFVVLRGMYAVALPAFESPDEYAHLDLVEHVAEGHAYPPYDGKRVSAFAQRAFVKYSCASRPDGRRCRPGTGGLSAADAPLRAERFTAEELDTTREAKGRNQLAQHPPLYYQVMGGALWAQRGLTGPLHVDQDLGFLRLLNVVLLAPLPMLVWLTARRVGAAEPAAQAAALLPLAVPQLLAITASVNNDNLFTLLSVAAGLAAARVATGDLRIRTGAIAGALVGLAMFTKGFGVVLPPALLVAYLAGFASRRPGEADTGALARKTAAGLGAAAVTTFAAGGWWYALNVVRHGALAPSIEDTSRRVPGFEPDRVFFVKRFLAWMVERFWGWFGAFDVRMSVALIGFATALLGAGLIAAFVKKSERAGDGRARPGPLLLGTLLTPAVLLLALVAQHAWSRYSERSTTPFIQGRYLFAAIGGIAVVSAVGFDKLAGRARRYLPMMVLVAAAVMNADALERVLTNYWGPVDAPFPDRLRALGAWNPWPGSLQGLGLVAAAVVIVVSVAVTVRAIDRTA